MTMSSKEKEVVLRMLELYKGMPYLWDRQDENYRNKRVRTQGLEILCEVYKEFEPIANIKTVSKKLINLRTNYFRELKKVKNSLVGPGPVHVPNTYYYQALNFLDGDNTHSLSNDPLDQSDSRQYISPASSDAGSTRNGSETAMSPPNPAVKKPRMSLSNFYDEPNQFMSTKLKEEDWVLMGKPGLPGNSAPSTAVPGTSRKEDDWVILGKSIGLQLRDIEKKQLTITQKLISDAIYYAKFGRLTENSFIELGSNSDE